MSARYSPPRSGTSLLALACLSGAAAAGCQALYLRRLATVLGDMFYVHAALLGVCLLGLGLGARLARRLPRALWACELAAGFYALAFPALAHAYPGSAFDRLVGDPALAAVSASVLLLAVPAMAFGVSIPLFAAYLRHALPGPRFDRVYLVYNLGAAAGVLAVEFLLVRALGLSRSLYALGALSTAIGLALLHPSLRAAARAEEPERGALGPRDLPALALLSLASAVFSGFYLKVCYHLFLPHRENFAVCSAAAFLSFAAGARLARGLRPSFAGCALYAACALAAVYALFPAWTAAYRLLRPAADSAAALLALKLLFALILGAPQALLGAAIPALVRREDAVAADSGKLLLVSGAANAAGLAAFSLLLYPSLPFFALLALCAALLAAAARLHAGAGYLPRRALSAALALPLLARAASYPEARLHAMNLPFGPGASILTVKRAADDATLVWEPGRLALAYNGDPSILIRSRGIPNGAEAVEGVLAAATAPRRERALVLGLGSGISAGAAAALFARTDIVEINGAFAALAPRLSAESFGLPARPGARVVYEDGRRFVRAAPPGAYDAVLNTLPSAAYFAAGKLYTDEFLAEAKRALAPDGVYLTWFTFGDASNAGVEVLRATLRRHFARCGLLALRESYYLLACSDAPLRRRPPSALGLDPALRAALEAFSGESDLDLYLDALWLSDDALAAPPAAGTPLNTDDLPALEFAILAQGPELAREDSVARYPERFGLRLPDPAAEGPQRAARRARVLARHHPLLFRTRVWPIIERDPPTREAFGAERVW